MASIFPSPGLTLPDFNTLLIKGDYHASAPIHLALSYAQVNDVAKILLLAPSRARFTAKVKESNDGFLNDCGGSGRVASAARKVEML